MPSKTDLHYVGAITAVKLPIGAVDVNGTLAEALEMAQRKRGIVTVYGMPFDQSTWEIYPWETYDDLMDCVIAASTVHMHSRSLAEEEDWRDLGGEGGES